MPALKFAALLMYFASAKALNFLNCHSPHYIYALLSLRQAKSSVLPLMDITLTSIASAPALRLTDIASRQHQQAILRQVNTSALQLAEAAQACGTIVYQNSNIGHLTEIKVPRLSRMQIIIISLMRADLKTSFHVDTLEGSAPDAFEAVRRCAAWTNTRAPLIHWASISFLRRRLGGSVCNSLYPHPETFARALLPLRPHIRASLRHGIWISPLTVLRLIFRTIVLLIADASYRRHLLPGLLEDWIQLEAHKIERLSAPSSRVVHSRHSAIGRGIRRHLQRAGLAIRHASKPSQ